MNFFSTDIFIIEKEGDENADFFVLLNNICLYSIITLRRFLEQCIAFILPILVVYLEINVRYIMMTVTCQGYRVDMSFTWRSLFPTVDFKC